MNYEKIYNSLIFKRQNIEILPDDAIFEKHHVIPRSIRPDLIFEQTNIVRLTLKEHFVCHQLLVKIYAQKYGENSSEHIKMVNALFIMTGYKRYGKIISARQYSQLKHKYRENISEILKQAWKNYPKEKMDKLRAKRRINSSGKNNPMYGRSWQEGKSEEELLSHRLRTSIGLKNRTPEEKEETRRKINEALNKRTPEQKRMSRLKQSSSIKKFWTEHPEKLKEKSAKIGKTLLGRRKMFKEGEQPIFVKAKDIQQRLNEGWKFSLHEHIKDQSNPAYGRKWMHLKGSSRKEDTAYVKKEDIEHYIKLGYVFGKVCRPNEVAQIEVQ